MGEKGVWLGYARHTPEFLIAADSGIVKAYAVRRLPSGQQWDGERTRQFQGPLVNWKLDATEEPDMVELEDGSRPEPDHQPEGRVGSRTGERRSMYLSRKDFAEHGHTDGCAGCRDIASGKRGQMAPHTVACQKRIEEAVWERDPFRWDRFLLSRRQEEVSQERDERPADPEVWDDADDQGSLYGGWDHRDLD